MSTAEQRQDLDSPEPTEQEAPQQEVPPPGPEREITRGIPGSEIVETVKDFLSK
jgi:hypothetical protein